MHVFAHIGVMILYQFVIPYDTDKSRMGQI